MNRQPLTQPFRVNRFAGNAMMWAGRLNRRTLQATAGVGRFTCEQWDELRHAAAVIGTVLCACVQPRCYGPAMRKAFARQILSIGVEPLWFVGAVAVFVGISVVV